jgi:hypothetical protein
LNALHRVLVLFALLLLLGVGLRVAGEALYRNRASLRDIAQDSGIEEVAQLTEEAHWSAGTAERSASST